MTPFTVPARTPAKECRGCGAAIYWIETATGKRMPVDCAGPEGRAPSATEDGQGVSHFATCPQATRFRK